MSKQKAAVGSSGTLHGSAINSPHKKGGRTEPLPSDSPESLEVDLILCILEKVLFSGDLTDK